MNEIKIALLGLGTVGCGVVKVLRTHGAEMAERAGCRVWRTAFPGTGGIVATGPRDHPTARAAFLAWPGRWGSRSWFGSDGGGPLGPAHQAGWCAEGAAPCS